MLEESRIFCCYSKRLKEFLLDKGLRYEIIGKHPSNDARFWAFIKTPYLQDALAEWGRLDKTLFDKEREQYEDNGTEKDC